MTKQELEDELARAKSDNDNLRFVCQRLIEANRHFAEAGRHQGEATKAMGEAVALLTSPTIPNN